MKHSSPPINQGCGGASKIKSMAFPTQEQLENATAEILGHYGLDLEGIKISRAGKKSIVAIAVDCDEHVNSDTLEKLSGDLSMHFDELEESGELNFGPGYTLEVGTPGVDLPLTHPRHWRRNRARLVAVRDEAGKKSTWRVGAMDEAQENVILIGREGKKQVVQATPLENVAGAVVEIEFAKPPAAEADIAAMSYEEAVTYGERN